MLLFKNAKIHNPPDMTKFFFAPSFLSTSKNFFSPPEKQKNASLLQAIKLLLSTYHLLTNSLSTPTTVGDDRFFIMLKSLFLGFIKKV